MRRAPSTPDELVAAHLPLARRIAARYCARLNPLQAFHDDIESAALYGLVQAAQRYQGSKGATFAKFATTRIRGAIADAMRAADMLSRDARAKQRRERPDAPAVVFGGEVARQLMGASLDNRNSSSQRRPVVWTNPDQESSVYRGQLRRTLTAAIRTLPERTQRILQLRFIDGLTLVEVGRVVGVCEERVCQIEGQALRELRDVLDVG